MYYYRLISSMLKAVISTLTTSLYAVYKAESNANDSLATYNGTAMGGLTYTAGKSGNAFTFNGTTAYVDMGDVMDLGLSSWSYSMWFNVSTTNNSMLFSKTIAASSFGRFWAGTNASKVYFAFQVDFPNSNIVIETTSNISTNTWYHVTFVFDRSDKMKIYLNGSLSGVNTTSGTNNLISYSSWDINTNHPFRIGAFTTADNIGTTANFTGQIDEFNIWNRVLNTTEITELYNAGTGKFYPY